MTKAEGWIFIAAVCVALVMAQVYKYGTERSQMEHCNDALGGVALKDGGSGKVICVRRDSVIKVY